MSEKKINRTSVIMLILSLTILIAGSLLLLQTNKNEHTVMPGYSGLGGEFILQSAEGPVSLSDYKDKTIV